MRWLDPPITAAVFYFNKLAKNARHSSDCSVRSSCFQSQRETTRAVACVTNNTSARRMGRPRIRVTCFRCTLLLPYVVYRLPSTCTDTTAAWSPQSNSTSQPNFNATISGFSRIQACRMVVSCSVLVIVCVSNAVLFRIPIGCTGNNNRYCIAVLHRAWLFYRAERDSLSLARTK